MRITNRLKKRGVKPREQVLQKKKAQTDGRVTVIQVYRVQCPGVETVSGDAASLQICFYFRSRTFIIWNCSILDTLFFPGIGDFKRKEEPMP